jgi:hypothetical protein
LFPIDVDAERLGTMADLVLAERGSLDGFDIAVRTDPSLDLEVCAARGATWSMTRVDPGASPVEVAAMIRRGPESLRSPPYTASK